MPYSVNGIGTALVKASKPRNVGGYIQYDAIEAFTILEAPIVPYKSIHILAIWQGGGFRQKQYKSLKLKFSRRLVAKAMLNGWGNLLILMGGAITVLLAFVFYTMSRPVTASDIWFLIGSIAALIVGLACKGGWYLLNNPDERVKDVIGPHELGTSDPLDWPDDLAADITKKILEKESVAALMDAANRAHASGNRARAMFCLRLAMRTEKGAHIDNLFQQLLSKN